MNRRTFVEKSFKASAVFAAAPLLSAVNSQNPNVRLGGPLFDVINGPDEWVAALKKQGYRAAYCPVKPDASTDIINAYALAAKKADIELQKLAHGVIHERRFVGGATSIQEMRRFTGTG